MTEASSTTLSPLAGLRVLVAEDHPVNQRVLELLLAPTGCRLTFCDDGALALAAFRETNPDLVLLDVIMPDTTGPDVANIVLNDAELKDIPFIFLTAIVTKDEIGLEPMKEIKGHMFIQKPVDIKTLLSSVNEMISKARERKRISQILSRKPPEN